MSGSGQRTPAAAFEAYDDGRFESAVDMLVAIRSGQERNDTFRRGPEQWVSAAPASDRERRLHVTAALSVELMARSFNQTRADFYATRWFVEWACEQLRAREPSAFERLFHVTSIALLQGARDERMLSGSTIAFSTDPPTASHILHAAQRFPAEPRLRLALVTSRHEAQSLASWALNPGYLLEQDAGRVRADVPKSADRMQSTLQLLDDVSQAPEVRAEARLRREILQFLTGAAAAAIPDLTAALESREPFVRYLAHVMLGQIADARGDVAAAAAHYRRAFDDVPATAAATSLASALFRLGRTSEADAVLERWREHPRPGDPWRLYGQRDYRFVPALLAEIRRMIRP